MAFTGNEDHTITLEEASRLTRNFRKSAEPGSKLGTFFGKSTLQQILDQRDCVGIRYYYGLKDDGTPVLVLVGADANENDMVDGIIAEKGIPCPPACGEPDVLNS
jgi:hypothetical protein